MKTQIATLLIALLFCAARHALCAWTEQNCEADGTTCYNMGTANCHDHSCAYQSKPDGNITIYNNENDVVATGKYDMSKTADDNCTEIYQSE